MELKELERIAKLCRKYGISSLESKDLKLSFSDQSPSFSSSKEAKDIVEDQPDQEKVLFWSADQAS